MTPEQRKKYDKKRRQDPRVKEYDRKRHAARWAKMTKEERANKHYKTKYGITYDTYLIMVEERGGKCDACKKEAKLVVDHDHKTGKLRGMLCHHCNTAIGLFKENTVLMRKAEQYLKKYKTPKKET